MIFALLRGYPSSNINVDERTVDAIVDAVEEYSVEALERAATRFSRGEVEGHNNAFPPSGAQLAQQAKLFDDVLKRASQPSVPIHSGILEMDFGHGRIDMRGLTVSEQDEVIRLGGKTADGRNLALMSLPEKRQAIAEPSLKLGKTVRPQLKRMTGNG